MIIAIDGPAGSGKSTIAREVAKRLGMRYLDTGAMYRTVTLLALEAGLVPERLPEAGALAASVSLRLEERADDLTRVFVGERDVSGEIRGPLVSKNVSAISAEPSVRAVLTNRQRVEASSGDVVLEGRDMGTVVVPDAKVKVFLTATVEERARRRHAQLEAQGVQQSVEQLVNDIATRDSLDSGRKVAPLKKAADAVEIDTTGMSITEVIDAVCALAESAKTELPGKWPLSRMQRGPLDTFVYRMTYFVLRHTWRFFYRIRVKGVENFPLSGPVVVACNHRAMTDPFFLGINVPRQIHYMAKVELWKFAALRWAMENFGTFPVNRGEPDRSAIKRGLEILEAGEVLGLFPEGRCNDTPDQLQPLRAGISLFSLRDGVVTVPAVLRGTDLAFKHGLPHFPKIDVVIGPPLSLPGPEVSRSERGRVVTERVREALLTLLATPVDR
jgi:cytidylate kinase